VSNVEEVLYEVRFRKGTKGRVAFVSDSVSAILGYRPQEFLRHPNLWASLLHPDDSAAAAEAQQRLPERPEGFVRVYRMRHKQTGEWRWMEDKVAPHVDRSGRLIGLFGAARDVTERKQVEASLRENEERLRMALEAGRMVAWEWDRATDVVRYSPDAGEVFGFTVATGEAAFAAVHPEDLPAFSTRVREAAERGGTHINEYRLIRPGDGAVLWVQDRVRVSRDASGRVSRVQGVVFDITERKQALEALRTSELRFRAVFDSVGEAVFVISPDGRFLDVNPSAERVFGYTADELRGRSTEILHVDRQHYEEFLARVAGPFARGMATRFEFDLKRRNGEVFPTDRVVSQLRGPDGEPIGIVSVVRDISERRKADTILRESREQLRALSQHLLEALELERRHLARGLHDDIGQLLTAVRLNIQTAQRTTGAETAAGLLDEALAVIDKGIEAVRGLALDLRPPLLDDVGLAAALRWYLDRHAARAGLAVNLVTCALNCRLPGDVETACFRVAQEAVTNVVRHASARKVEVEVRCQDGWADLFIRDDGVGFDVAERARRTESVGLLGMRERVLLLGGEITVDSGSERGTTVWARIPVPKGTA
jgi:PAS domain S-box-containing protein